MYRRPFSGARNKLDLNDRVQVRIVRKRVSNEQLSSLVRTAGNSITAVRKEAGSKRLLTLPPASDSPCRAARDSQDSFALLPAVR